MKYINYLIAVSIFLLPATVFAQIETTDSSAPIVIETSETASEPSENSDTINTDTTDVEATEVSGDLSADDIQPENGKLPTIKAEYNTEDNSNFKFYKFDPTFQLAQPVEGDTMMVIETNKGTIIIKLFPDKTPITFNRMKELIDSGFYDTQVDENGNETHIRFHRVVSDFMIQTGDPNSRDDDPNNDGSGGSGEKFDDEIVPELRNIRGALSMANSGQNTNDSQFFINVNDRNMFLDGKYNVWGQVYSGMNIADYMASKEIFLNPGTENAQGTEKPSEDLYIESVKLMNYSDEIESMIGSISETDVTPPTTEAPIVEVPLWHKLLKVFFYILLGMVGILIILLIVIRIKFGNSSKNSQFKYETSGKTKRKKKSKNYGKQKKRKKK